jgi:hypothetical protein
MSLKNSLLIVIAVADHLQGHAIACLSRLTESYMAESAPVASDIIHGIRGIHIPELLAKEALMYGSRSAASFESFVNVLSEGGAEVFVIVSGQLEPFLCLAILPVEPCSASLCKTTDVYVQVAQSNAVKC